MSKFTRVIEAADKESYLFICPGCECTHQIWVKGHKLNWAFNGDVNKPTCSPKSIDKDGAIGRPKNRFAPIRCVRQGVPFIYY